MEGTARLTLVPPIESDAGSHPGTLRLTRRGRLVVLIVFLAAVLAGGVLVGSDPSRASGALGEPTAYRWIVVQPGQTLWGIAEQTAPETDPRVTIKRIRDLNALRSTGVQAGQRIALP